MSLSLDFYLQYHGGANIGTCTLLIAANGVPTVAFEPMPPNYKIFARSILGNSPAFDDMIMLYPYGIGDSEGCFTAYTQFNNMGNSMLNNPVPIHKRDQMVRESVEVKMLDDLLWANWFSGAPPPTVHLMKLDVQGYEFKAFKGAQHLLAAGAISMIEFENESHMMNAQGTSYKLSARIQLRGVYDQRKGVPGGCGLQSRAVWRSVCQAHACKTGRINR
jgi:FkbM family methyltransferase